MCKVRCGGFVWFVCLYKMQMSSKETSVFKCLQRGCTNDASKLSNFCSQHSTFYKCVYKGCNDPVAGGSLNFCKEHIKPEVVLRRNSKGKLLCIGDSNSCPKLSRSHEYKMCTSCARKSGIIYQTSRNLLSQWKI
jgi:hypothetical protein